jgi:hypothetical protein
VEGERILMNYIPHVLWIPFFLKWEVGIWFYTKTSFIQTHTQQLDPRVQQLDWSGFFFFFVGRPKKNLLVAK